MSATTTQMTDAIDDIEAALLALATAYAAYEAGRSQAKSDRADAVGHLHAEVIDTAVGTSKLNHVIGGRLRALGAAGVLRASMSETPQAASWVTTWNAQVTALVP